MPSVWAPHCPYCGALWVGRGIGTDRVRPGLCGTCVGLVVLISSAQGLELRPPTPREREDFMGRAEVGRVAGELLEAEGERWTHAPGGRPGVRWHVLMRVAETGQVLLEQTAQWIVPPAGVDPQFYAYGRLAAALAGSDVAMDAQALAALPAGTTVVCSVREGDRVAAMAVQVVR